MSGSHRVFISAAPADQKWRAKLRKHLCILKGIEVRSDDDVAPGDDQQVAIVDELSRADIILVLISPDYFNSTKHRDIHLPLALQRHQRKQARVIPIPLRPCVWKDGPIGSLQCLPRNEQYVSIGKSESVLAGIAAELRELLGGERARSVEERGHLLALGREDLLSRVESVSALKDGVKQVRRMDCAEPFRSFLDISFEKDGMTLQHPVVAVEQGVGEALVQALEQGLHTEYPRNAPPSVIVYEGPRAPDTLVQRANRAGITISHFDDYSRLIDFNEYLRRQTARLESDQIYPPRLYVGQKADLLEPITGHAPDALTTLADWLAKEGPRFVLLLGDFGTGKTFLLHELARRLGGMPNPPMVPLLIEMRQLDKQHKLEALVAAHLATTGLNRFDWSAFKYMLESGRIALLFDGFDELAFRVKYDRAVEHFDTLLQAAGEQAKVVVTSRTQHFRSTAQVRTALGERVSSQRGYVMAMLRPFEHGQIRQFLENKLESKEEANARFELLDEVKKLLGLSENPRMLSFIADIPEEQLRAAAKRDGEISAAGLYQALLDRWLLHEYERVHPRGVQVGLSVADRWKAVTELALLLWGRTDKFVSLSELPMTTARAISDLVERALDPEVAGHHIGSGTLLTRDEEERFSFFHQSIMEWLVAREAAAQVKRSGDSRLLSARAMSELMAQFFGSLAGREIAAWWGQSQIAAMEASLAAKTNARLVLKWLEIEIKEGANFAGRDLRGADFWKQDLRHVDFTGADLTDAILEEAELEGARLNGATLLRANFTRANLSGADLSNAEASWARFTGANLSGAVVRGMKLERAALIGVKWGERADYPEAAVTSRSRAKCPEVQTFASAACSAITYSLDGALIVSGHDDGSVRIWEAANGVLLRTLLAHTGPVRSVAVSPDGARIASGSDDETIRIWEPDHEHPIRVLQGHSDGVQSVAFSCDGRLLASGSYDKTIRIWEPDYEHPLRTLQGHSNWFQSVAFSPDGRFLACGSHDHTIHIWDPDQNQPLRTLQGHSNAVQSISFSPDGKHLASSSDDHTIRIWDPGRGQSLRTLQGHSNAVQSVAYSPDGKRLASGSYDKTIRIWDPDREQPLRTLQGHANAVYCVSFSPDGRRLASGAHDHTIRIWDPDREQPLRTLQGQANAVFCIAFSPDGKRLASGAYDRTIRLWDTDREQSLRTLQGHSLAVQSVSFSPDGRQLASGSYDKTIRIWDPDHEQPLRTLQGHSNGVRSVTFSPDGKRLASGSNDHTICIWDPDHEKPLRTLQGHSDSILCVTFSPDGERLASGALDHTVRIWALDSSQPLRTLHGHSNAVTCISVHPDGKRFASSSDDYTIRIWDADRNRPLRTLQGHSNSVLCVAFSPDGTHLASGSDDYTIRIWDPDYNQSLRTLRGHSNAILCLAFSPDGKRLASSSYDNTIRLWDVETGTHLYTILYTPEGWAAFTPDGRYKYEGDARQYFWHLIGLTRYEPGELDPYWPTPLRVPDGERLAPPK